MPIYAQPGRIQDTEVLFRFFRAQDFEKKFLLPETFRPRGLITLASHYSTLRDAASGVEEFNRSRPALASRLDNDLPVIIDQLPPLYLRESCANQADGHSVSKQAYSGFLDAYLGLIAFLGRRADGARRGQQENHAGKDR
jgi:hypothetical protein